MMKTKKKKTKAEIKAIETEYKGYRFRSRLEARWAVFFDACKIDYEYEPEGYEDKEIKYLPDFYLPKFDLHCEVKSDTEKGRQEILDKCEKIIKWGGDIKQILILSDIPEGRSVDGGLWHFPVMFWEGVHVTWGWWFFYESENDNGEIFARGHISSASYKYAKYWCMEQKQSIKAVSDTELRLNSYPYKEIERFSDIEIQEAANGLIFNALKKARQARFEHGECG